MDKIELHIRGKHHTFEGPFNWNEVPVKMAQQLFRLMQLVIHKPYAYIMLPELLYGIPRALARWLFDADHIRGHAPGITPDELDACISQGLDLMQHTTWVQEGNPPNIWLLKELKMDGKIFCGPEDDLATSTFEEFMFAEQFYQDNEVSKLLATLYRVGADKNYDNYGDRRYPFRMHSIDVMHKAFERVPEEVKQLVLFNYRGIRMELARCYENVFKVSKDNSNSEGTWLDVACGLAGENISNLSSIRTENLHIVLKYLDHRIKVMDSLKPETV